MRYEKKSKKLVLSFVCFLALFLVLINGVGPIQEIGNDKSVRLSTLIYRDNFSPTELLIRFSSSYTREANNRTIKKAGAKETPSIVVFVLEVENGEMNQTIEYLQQQENIIYAEPNYIVGTAEISPNDPDWGRQYILAPAGWSLKTGAIWVMIAIRDHSNTSNEQIRK